MIISLHSVFNKKRRIFNKDFVKFMVIKPTFNCRSRLFLFFSLNFTDIMCCCIYFNTIKFNLIDHYNIIEACT